MADLEPIDQHHAQAAAFLSLARTQRRIAGQYARWAREAEQAGNRSDYRHYRAEAEKKRDDVRFQLRMARNRFPKY